MVAPDEIDPNWVNPLLAAAEHVEMRENIDSAGVENTIPIKQEDTDNINQYEVTPSYSQGPETATDLSEEPDEDEVAAKLRAFHRQFITPEEPVSTTKAQTAQSFKTRDNEENDRSGTRGLQGELHSTRGDSTSMWSDDESDDQSDHEILRSTSIPAGHGSRTTGSTSKISEQRQPSSRGDCDVYDEESNENDDEEDEDESPQSDADTVSEVADDKVIQRHGTPTPEVNRAKAGWYSDHCQDAEYKYSNRLTKALPRGFDWQQLAEDDPHLRQKFCSFSDSGLGRLIYEYDSTAPLVPSCVTEARKLCKSGMRWGDWFFQQLLKAIREGNCDIDNRARSYVKLKVVWRTDKQRKLWLAKGVVWPMQKFTPDKTLPRNSYFTPPTSIPVSPPRVRVSLGDNRARGNTKSRSGSRVTQPERRRGDAPGFPLRVSTSDSEQDDLITSKPVEQGDDADQDADNEDEDDTTTKTTRPTTSWKGTPNQGNRLLQQLLTNSSCPTEDEVLPELDGSSATNKLVKRNASSQSYSGHAGNQSIARTQNSKDEVEMIGGKPHKIVQRRHVSDMGDKVRMGCTGWEEASDPKDSSLAIDQNFRPSDPSARRHYLAQGVQQTEMSPSEEVSLPHPTLKIIQTKKSATNKSALPASSTYQSPDIQSSIEPIQPPKPIEKIAKMGQTGKKSEFSAPSKTQGAKPETSKSKANKEWGFTVKKPESGWGQNAPTDATKLPEGYHYWKKTDTKLKDGEADLDLDYTALDQIPTKGVPVFSYVFNTSDENRLDETWVPPPGTLLDEAAVFVVTLSFSKLERYKRWPLMFSKNGISRQNKPAFGLPPLVGVGNWKDHDTFSIKKYYFLVFRRQVCLRGVVGLGGQENKIHGQGNFDKLRELAKDDVREWNFGMELLNPKLYEMAGRLHPRGLVLWYTCDGRELDKAFATTEIDCNHNAAWFDKMIQECKAPLCIKDEIFNSTLPATKKQLVPAVESRKSGDSSDVATKGVRTRKQTQMQMKEKDTPVRQRISLGGASSSPRSGSKIDTPTSTQKRSHEPTMMQPAKRVKTDHATVTTTVGLASAEEIEETIEWFRNWQSSGEPVGKVEGVDSVLREVATPLMTSAKLLGRGQDQHKTAADNLVALTKSKMQQLESTRAALIHQTQDLVQLRDQIEYMNTSQPLNQALLQAQRDIQLLETIAPPSVCGKAVDAFLKWFEGKRQEMAIPTTQSVPGLDELDPDAALGQEKLVIEEEEPSGDLEEDAEENNDKGKGRDSSSENMDLSSPP